MSDFSEEEMAIIAVVLEEEERRKEDDKEKKTWVHDMWRARATEGEFSTLYKMLKDDQLKFYEYFRMTQNTFEILISKVGESLKKQDTPWRLSITPRERLAVCLRFLATGDSFKSISFSYRLGHSTVQTIVNETCRVIVSKLMAE
ncbi:uncharacterized protein LOC143181873, partial [Calliopsis andreniformis]|uniref:uncharacterized protein LOC143181873 n=1 Tax=Calliopsis andreniformis TaxID=337506 RepID=UPI003FCDEE08